MTGAEVFDTCPYATSPGRWPTGFPQIQLGTETATVAVLRRPLPLPDNVLVRTAVTSAGRHAARLRGGVA